MKASFYLTLLFLSIIPLQGDALSCCFVDLFCSKTCLTESFLTAGSPRILTRGLRSVFAQRRAHHVAPHTQMDSDLFSRIRRDIRIQKFARRLFAPTQHLSRDQDLRGTRNLASLGKLDGSH